MSVKHYYMDEYFAPADPAHVKKQKEKAKELRASQWWRNTVGKGICYHCEKKFKPTELTMDHLVPIIRGGESNKQNCVPSCKDCNSKKGYKTKAELALDELKAASQSIKKPDSDDK